jgi:hypothetical protein
MVWENQVVKIVVPYCTSCRLTQLWSPIPLLNTAYACFQSFPAQVYFVDEFRQLLQHSTMESNFPVACSPMTFDYLVGFAEAPPILFHIIQADSPRSKYWNICNNRWRYFSAYLTVSSLVCIFPCHHSFLSWTVMLKKVHMLLISTHKISTLTLN